MVHRLSWEIFKGPIPENMCVCHSCDVRECCNPEHLFIGSRRENFADMVEKDRGTGPTKKCKRVLSHDEVEEVLLLKNSGWTYQQLKDRYGLSVGSLHEIVNGRNKGPKPELGRRQYRSLMDKRPCLSNQPVSITEKSSVKRKKLSMYKGVTKNKNSGKWVVMYKGSYVGSFTDEVEAALAFDDHVVKHEGPEGVTNAKLGNYKNVFGEETVEPEEVSDSTEDRVKILEDWLGDEISGSDEKSKQIAALEKRIRLLEEAVLASKCLSVN